MAFKMKTTKGGYTTTLPDKIISQKQPIYSLSTELEPQQRFEEGKPTGEIVAMIQFDTLQACEVKYNVYFKANGIKEVR